MFREKNSQCLTARFTEKFEFTEKCESKQTQYESQNPETMLFH